MNQSIFDEIIDRRNTNSIKWDPELLEKICGSPEAIPLWVADMDFLSPEPVRRALQERAEHGIFGYTMDTASTFEAFAAWLKDVHRWSIDSSNFIFSPGIVTALATSVRTYTELGDAVMIQTPAYRPFFNVIRNNGRKIIENPLTYHKGRYSLDFDDMERKMSGDDVKVMLFCSPHNPAGRVWSRKELLQTAELAERFNVLVVSDEIHGDLTYGNFWNSPKAGQGAVLPRHTPFGTLNDFTKKYSITCMAPSKTFNIPGEPFSSIIIQDDALRLRFQRTIEAQAVTHPSLFALTAAEAAYRGGRPWLTELTSYLLENLEYMTERLRKELPEVVPVVPEASFIAFLDVQELEERFAERISPHGDLTRFLGREAGICLHRGTWFGAEGKGFARINFGLPRRQLKEALDRFIGVFRPHQD